MPRLRPYLVLAALWALYFHPLVLHPTHTLYADFSDFLAEHLPARLFLNHEWRTTGELPLWNPYHFCGTPFVHDIQVGCFYPPYAVAYLVPEAAVGAALSWVVALHVLLAGVLAYRYARAHELGEVGALVAAVGFMLSAKWMTHLLLAGHTVTVGLAWLPLVLLGLERATWGAAVWAGAALALLVLGTHPQWAFYAGVFAAAWTVPAERSRRTLLRWALRGLAAATVAVLLCAVQLLPTLEAAGQSARTVGLEATGALRVGFYTLFGMVGPSVGNDPPRSWEQRGLFGLFWLAAAFAAPVLARGRTRWRFGVFCGLLAFSVGGAALVEWLPGFRLFRIPSRMLLVAAFPLAYLAGVTTDALVRSAWDAAGRRGLRRAALGVGLFAAAPALLCLGVLSQQDPVPVWGEFVAFWAVVAVGAAVVVWLCFPRDGGNPRARTAAWAALLLAELVAPTLLFPAVRPQADIYPGSDAVRYLAAHAPPGAARVLEIDAGTGPRDRYAPLGVGSPQSLVHRVETARGYNPLDVRHYRAFVGYVIGLDDSVLALAPVAQPIIPNFPRTNRSLFDLLNVRYLVCYPEYVSNPELQADPGHRLELASWRFAAQFKDSPAVPALPPTRPDPLLRTVLIENLHHTNWPRAFVVPAAARMPAGGELAALTACDFRTTVLLTTDAVLPPNGTGAFRAARITDYRPNRVAVELDGAAGFLVLADVWFPGWTCRVDGAEVEVYRANHAFRAVALPAGAKEAVFAFEPRSYRLGWWASAATLAALVLAAAVRGVVRRVW